MDFCGGHGSASFAALRENKCKTCDIFDGEARFGGAEANWTELGTDMSPPFMDNRAPLVSGPPEERRFQAAYVDNDEVTTDWSATLTVIAHS